MGRGNVYRLLLVVVCLTSQAEELFARTAQAEPIIRHDAIECVIRGRHPLVFASFEPGGDPGSEATIQQRRVYFRAGITEGFYFVSMDPVGEEFQGILPIPDPETDELVYYVAAVDELFNNARTPDYVARIVETQEECQAPRPTAFVGGNPSITLGAVLPGAPAVPPGFLATGIAGIGAGPGTAIAIGAAATAAAGAGVLASSGGTTNGGDNAGSMPPVPCFTTSPTPPVVTEGGSIAFDASCTAGAMDLNLAWDFGPDCPPAQGLNVSCDFTTPGQHQVTLTVTSSSGEVVTFSTTVTVEPDLPPPPPSAPLEACFDTSPDPPVIVAGESVRFDASCSTPREQLEAYSWEFSDSRAGSTGRVVSRVFLLPGTYPVTLTVVNANGERMTVTREVIVKEPPPPPPPPPPGPSPVGADLAITKIANPMAPSVLTPFDYVIEVVNNGPETATGITMTDSLPVGMALINVAFTPPLTGCNFDPVQNRVTCPLASLPSGISFTVILRVVALISGSLTNMAEVTSTGPADPDPTNNMVQLTTSISLRDPSGRPAVTSSFATHLIFGEADGGVNARVLVNGALSDETDNSAPFRHAFRGRRGDNRVEAQVLTPLVGEGQWRFVFRGSPSFVPDSFEVESGQLLSRGGDEIVFRVSDGGEVIRFRFRLSDE